MTESIFELHREKHCKDYLQLCAEFEPKIDIDGSLNKALRSVKHYRGDSAGRESSSLGQELEVRWYESLAEGKPDYSVYNDPAYVCDIWACWAVYSRKYLL